MYLFDTNVISELRKSRPHGAVTAWFSRLREEDIRVPAVVIAELQNGAELTRKQNPAKALELERWIDQILASLVVLSMDGPIFRDWARLMIGKSADLAVDGMIAATARAHRLTVVTRNVKDFKPFNVQVFNPFSYSPERPR